jgi:hypothetical protein
MPLDETIIQAVANANFKTMAELAVQNAITDQQQLNILSRKSLAKSLEAMDTTDVTEGLGIAAAQRGDISKVISELGAAVGSLQGLAKMVGNIPPVTP